ncbi:very short patch repair endonuclease [Bacteroides neonati]|uniref:very short patch repair endonuclease n=1 Tax=Bacteroides neonati TaxID=1347393 RepID=UPI0004B6954E|nr:very short patch repair endonuclease [Bacteroides neonati]
MADVLTKEQRHRNMAAIRGKGTKPEMLVRKFLFSHGFRYRLNHPRLPGHPDIVLRKYRTAIFVNGCFWHGHDNCRYFRLPKTNIDFWQKKIERNKERDKKEQCQLATMGWHYITIWECQLKPKVRMQTLESLVYTLNHIFLEDRKIKAYKIVENYDSLMVAESEVAYGETNK